MYFAWRSCITSKASRIVLRPIPPVVLADIFGKDNIGSIRGYSEPFVSAGQAIGGISAGLIYDFTGSYTLSFPMFAFIALLAW